MTEDERPERPAQPERRRPRIRRDKRRPKQRALNANAAGRPRSKAVKQTEQELNGGGQGGFGESVENGPFRDVIDDMLRSRWSPRAVVRYLRQQYAHEPHLLAQVPSHSTVNRWRERHVRAADLLPVTLLEELVGDMKRDVDVYQELLWLYPAAKDRFAMQYKMEKDMGIVTEAGDRAARTAVDILTRLFAIGQNIGEYPKLPVPAGALVAMLPAPNADQPEEVGMVGLSMDEQKELYELLYRRRHGNEMPDVESPAQRRARGADDPVEAEYSEIELEPPE